MKILFCIFHGLDASNGISKKILAQVRALQEIGHDTRLCYYEISKEGNRYWMVANTVIGNLGNGLVSKIRKRISYHSITSYIQSNNIEMVYLRSDHNANPFTIYWLRQLRMLGVKIALEVPTYPYDQEYSTILPIIRLGVDKLFRYSLAKQTDAIVTFTNEKNIFGQRTITISNGIDFSTIPLRINPPFDGSELHLIGVAEIHFWHGFDRVLTGLADYYANSPKCKVYFHMVGRLSGKREQKEILPLINKYKLQDYIILHGQQWGKDLDGLFNLAHFAIGSLGRHRSGIDAIRTLKNREYAARGIPFIYSETDSDFETAHYILKATADEQPISIEKILKYVENSTLQPERIRSSIAHLAWSKQMEKVIRKLYE